MISLSHVNKQYGRQLLFVDASFQLNPGDRVGLVGPNGAGKTTLFRMIVAEEAPDEGEVSVPKRLTVGYFRQDVEEMAGRSVLDGRDREGFSGGASQFDSDITADRHPRCALGMSDDELLVVCCDGRRSRVDAGLFLDELARLLISFGADEAINLDGGGSATLVHRKHLLNRPYSDQDQPAPESRPVVTALLFERVG